MLYAQSSCTPKYACSCCAEWITSPLSFISMAVHNGLAKLASLQRIQASNITQMRVLGLH